jgi:thiamine-phosphate pyrophosphorylase
MDDVLPDLQGPYGRRRLALQLALANDVHQYPMKPLADCKLYAFVDTAYLNGRTPEFIARQLCDGGADLIQLRAKESSLDEIRRVAKAILPITSSTNVGLVINDHLSVAREVGAELCHLGQEDFFGQGCSHVSSLAEPGPPPPKGEGRGEGEGLVHQPTVHAATEKIQIGLSTHSPDQAHKAIAAGAHYIAIGPVYATNTKPGAKPVTLEYVRWAAANVKVPWFAIGGINLDNLGEVQAAGAQRICVVSAILNSHDIAETCRRFKKHLS